MVAGDDIVTAAHSGLKGMVIGAVSGFVVNGLLEGIQSVFNNANFWTGKVPAGVVLKGTKIPSTQKKVSTPTQTNIQESSIIYPPNKGFLGETQEIELNIGTIVDRFGGTSDNSRFLAPYGTPIEMRSLPPNINMNLYDRYQVIKPFKVQSGIIAPYFGQVGMGTQYVTSETIKTLLKKGYLIKLR